jgi:hypothetical protein
MPVEEVPECQDETELPLERLEAEITELAGHLWAAESRWLALVAEFDRRKGHEAWGCRTAAQWLAWQCGLDGRAAREKVRVARALEVLPAITERFAVGALSYSKVRALTRIATPSNERDLAPLAEAATAVQVERIVRAYRGVLSSDEERERANEQHASRYLRIDPDDDGTFVINGRIPADLAAIVLAAIEAARARLPLADVGPGDPADPDPGADRVDPGDHGAGPAEAADSVGPDLGGPGEHGAGRGGPGEHGAGSADPVEPGGGPAGPPARTIAAGVAPSFAATNVDALVMMAETLLANGPSARKGGDRYQIVVNVDAEVLVEDADSGICEIDDGSHLAAETVRRMMCDASQVFVLHDEHDRPVDVSRKARTIPPSLRRSVHARDQGCRFPGCGERTFVDVHHVRHRAHGGLNELANLVQLCWFHHRLVHEGGWNVRLDAEGTVHAVRPDGELLARPPLADGAGSGGARGVRAANRARGVAVGPGTCASEGYGERLDLDHAVSSLVSLERTSSRLARAPSDEPEPAAASDSLLKRSRGTASARSGSPVADRLGPR